MKNPRKKTAILPKRVDRKVRNSLTYLAAFCIVMIACATVYRGGLRLATLSPEEVTVNELPSALLLSFARMLVSYLASLAAAFLIGIPAARHRPSQRILLPLLEVLQAVPVVGFFPAAVSLFINLTNGHRLGVELAACFLIFTSQAWNMAFSVYESVKGIPQDHIDAVRGLGLRGSVAFFKLYVPATVPKLVFNSMLSWSNGWFFLVACEIFAVGPVQFHLPGIGSFLARAAEANQIHLVFNGIFALGIFILLLDLIFWRPIQAWSQKFKTEWLKEESDLRSDFLPVILPRTILDRFIVLRKPILKMIRVFFSPLVWLLREIILPLAWDLPVALAETAVNQTGLRTRPLVNLKNIAFVLFILLLAYGMYRSIIFIMPPWPDFVGEIPVAILASTGRLLIALFISLSWVMPLAYFVWNKPKLRQTLSTISQVFASLPAIALFPLFILIVVKRLGGGMEVNSILLLLTGMQWYVLFNVLAGCSTISGDHIEVVKSLGLSKWIAWKRLVFPSMRSTLMTGLITAWGGGWNALVVAEYVVFQNKVEKVHGIGSLLDEAIFQQGNPKAAALCLVAMIAWIVFLDVIFWRPVYQLSIERNRE